MAKTPESILKAPQFTPVQVVTHTGLNRQRRRAWPKHLRPRATNQPVRKAAVS